MALEQEVADFAGGDQQVATARDGATTLAMRYASTRGGQNSGRISRETLPGVLSSSSARVGRFTQNSQPPSKTLSPHCLTLAAPPPNRGRFLVSLGATDHKKLKQTNPTQQLGSHSIQKNPQGICQRISGRFQGRGRGGYVYIFFMFY